MNDCGRSRSRAYHLGTHGAMMVGRQTNCPCPILPAQHGAWSILIAACITGSLAATPWHARTWLLLAAILAGFVGQHHVRTYLKIANRHMPQAEHSRSLAIALLVFSALCGTWLTLASRLYWLGLFALLGALSLGVLAAVERSRKSLTLTAQLTGTFGLSLAALATAYCQVGRLTAPSIALWGACALFFCGSVLHVRSLVRRHRQRIQGFSGRLKAGLPSVVYHVLAVNIILYASLMKPLLPRLSVLTFLPALLKAVWSVFSPAQQSVSIRRIGAIELSHTLTFVLLTALIW